MNVRKVITTDHSPFTGYERLGCRCEACREHHNARVRANRQRRLKDGNLSHGTRSAFDAGCRCEDCRRARREAAVKLRESERERARYWARKDGAA